MSSVSGRDATLGEMYSYKSFKKWVNLDDFQIYAIV